MLAGQRENPGDAFGGLPGGTVLDGIPTRTDISLASCPSVAPLESGVNAPTRLTKTARETPSVPQVGMPA